MAVPPEWIDELVDRVVNHMHPSEMMNPVGCHFHHNPETEQWEVSVFVSDSQAVGGRLDGALVQPAFFLDLNEILALFDVIGSVYWQTRQLDQDDDVGDHISVEGEFRGNAVWLRVLGRAPAAYGPGRNVLVNSESVEDLW